MPGYKVNLDIRAPAPKVWALLGKFSTWNKWNPFFPKAILPILDSPKVGDVVVLDCVWKGKLCPDDKVKLIAYNNKEMSFKLNHVDNIFLWRLH